MKGIGAVESRRYSSFEYEAKKARRALEKGEPYTASNGMQDRFWFTVPEKHPVFVSHEKEVVEILRCDVVVLTEAEQVRRNGKVKGTGQSSPMAQKWADTLSKHFPKLTKEHESFADMENIYRLRATLLAAYSAHAFQDSLSASADKFLKNHRYLDEKPMKDLETIVTHRTIIHREETREGSRTSGHWLHQIGGVSLAMPVGTKMLMASKERPALAELKAAALAARPSEESLTWRMPAEG